MTAADPDFPVAQEIVQDLQDYISEGYFSYTPKLGYPEFKEAIAESLNRKKNENVNPEWVLPIDSAARGMYIIAQTVLEKGNEAIVFDPVDYLFKNSVLSAGAIPVFFPNKLVNGRIDLSALESYISSKTKMICLCNPHNPLGCLFSREDLEFILDLCEKYDLWIMNDEIWSDIVYEDEGAEFLSILSLGRERNRKTLSVYGFSKAYGVAGLRIGCIYCMAPVIFDQIVEKSAVMTTAGGISSLSQIAGISCLEKCDYWTKGFVSYLQKNRDYAVERINSMSRIKTISPEATYVLWIDMSELGISNSEFIDYLKRKVKLALVEGSEKMFGPGAKGYIRTVFCNKP